APMTSFDLYDTLVTRLVAEPRGVFCIVAERCGIADFERLRSNAERCARRMARGREVTLDDIYAQLPLPDESKARARALEVDLEPALLAPVARNVARVRGGDLVVSDMYLPAALVRGIATYHVPAIAPAAVLVSSESGLRKSDGSIWRRLRHSHPGLRM